MLFTCQKGRKGREGKPQPPQQIRPATVHRYTYPGDRRRPLPPRLTPAARRSWMANHSLQPRARNLGTLIFSYGMGSAQAFPNFLHLHPTWLMVNSRWLRRDGTAGISHLLYPDGLLTLMDTPYSRRSENHLLAPSKQNCYIGQPSPGGTSYLLPHSIEPSP